jgi:MoaA/NifB/PqqE/SkfB family radical SAM enzyme
VARTETPVSVRVTLQRANYRQLPQFVQLARELGAQQLSFLAVDVANPHAFARQDDFTSDLALQPQDLPVFARILDDLEREHAGEFRSGLIADSPRKLRRIHQYFAAVCGVAPYPAVRCNVFEYSAVIGATGRVSPCFFIAGPSRAIGSDNLGEVLNHASMSALRAGIRAGERAECARCVCSLWRDPDRRGVADFLPRGRPDA